MNTQYSTSPSVPCGFSCKVSGSKILTMTLSRGTPTHPRRLFSHVLLPVDTTGAVCVFGGGGRGGECVCVCGVSVCVCVCVCVCV